MSGNACSTGKLNCPRTCLTAVIYNITNYSKVKCSNVKYSAQYVKVGNCRRGSGQRKGRTCRLVNGHVGEGTSGRQCSSLSTRTVEGRCVCATSINTSSRDTKITCNCYIE